jgi:hypothetical protein
MTVKLFISYAREDAPKAEGLQGDLEQAGYACWLDTSEILGGDEWVRSIAAGIEQADACLSLVSDTAQQSKWVLKATQYFQVCLNVKERAQQSRYR